MSTWSAGRGSKRMAPAPGGQAAFLRAWGFGGWEIEWFAGTEFRDEGGFIVKGLGRYSMGCKVLWRRC